MREVMLKLKMDYKMTKHMLNNCTLKESRAWLLVCMRQCYFIPFNHEHPVYEYLETESKSVLRIMSFSISRSPHRRQANKVTFLLASE